MKIEIDHVQRYVIQYVDENGNSFVTGGCNQCCCFPCKHIDTLTWTLKPDKEA